MHISGQGYLKESFKELKKLQKKSQGIGKIASGSITFLFSLNASRAFRNKPALPALLSPHAISSLFFGKVWIMFNIMRNAEPDEAWT